MTNIEFESRANIANVTLKPYTKFYGLVCVSITLVLLFMTLAQILAYYSHPLKNAIVNGDIGSLKQAIANGADVNAEDEYGYSMLNRTIVYGIDNIKLVVNQPEVRFQTINSMLQALLDAGADTNVVDSNKNLPLCLAVKWADINAVRLLIEKGADVNLRDGHGSTPLGRAEDAELQEIISLLVEKGAE
ncbi:MAG: ankyrin repeat domain-containing protein [Sedimentisphaerales bacterium]|nr:ankyrin repeat domain-containing protein [Sedimentisphaerales bacterium]